MLNFGHTFAHAIEMAIENNLRKDFIRHVKRLELEYYVNYIMQIKKKIIYLIRFMIN